VLFKDDNTGAIDLAFDPHDSRILYAALWQTRRPPWSIYPPSSGPGSGLYKSSDGGEHWVEVSGHGLPAEGLGRIGVAVAPTDSNRVYLIVDAKQGGLYRSDDAGQTWQRMDSEDRIWKRGWYFGGVTVDPKDPDTVYVSNTSLYRSRDGGKSFDAIKGAPGGDDYHSLWIAPEDPSRMISGSDQGTIISLDGAKTWSSWYNQPTAQFYHVITVNRFPYWICGAQQDSGAACTTSRSNFATISSRDWRPVGAGGESQYIAPDPLDTDVLYGGGFGGSVVRFSLTTDQTQVIAPALAHPGDYRSAWTLPAVFSPRNPRQLYFGTQVLFRTSDGGNTWQVLSPDLTREDPGVPTTLDGVTAADAPKGKRRGVIYTIAPSPFDEREIWVGTDDGLIQVTRDDGKTWHNVTPPDLTPWSKIGMLVASRHDARTVYAAVDRHRLDDYQPHFYRTRDRGATWQEISSGLPEGSHANAIREDPVRKGLLFAGTETGAYVSFDDGDHWQSLQLNLPNASIRDLAIQDDDLIVATHGRSFWVLDDITPLRQLSASAASAGEYLFRPRTAFRVRPPSFEGTPLPPEVPQGDNPPSGAIIDYYLRSAPSGPVTLEILDRAGKLARRYSSEEKPAKVDPKKLDIPIYWIHPAEALSAQAGMHRFEWDLRYAGPGGGGNPMARLFGAGGGPWAPPGSYSVRLTVNGHRYSQPLTLKKDPRVKTPLADFEKQFDLALRILQTAAQVSSAYGEAERLEAHLKSLSSKANLPADLSEKIKGLERLTEEVMGVAPAPNLESAGVEPPAPAEASLRHWRAALGEVERAVESADAAPTRDALTAYAMSRQGAEKALGRWKQILARALPELNERLRGAGLAPISAEAPHPTPTPLAPAPED
jgi:photosystem II stability/assembly factor-like uncharacterized protein